MFELKPIVKVETNKDMVGIVAVDTYKPPTHDDGLLRYWLWKIADQSALLVDAAVADHTQYRFFIDAQGYLVITHKEGNNGNA